MRNFSKISFALLFSAAVLFFSCSKKDLEPSAVSAELPESVRNGVKINAFVNPSTPTDYYVAPDGNNNNLGTFASPITLQFASDQSQPGDRILLKSGVYPATALLEALKVTVSGTPSAFITYKAADGQFPVIQASGSIYNAVRIVASYIIFDGIELIGNNDNIAYADALASFDFAYASENNKDVTRFGRYNTNGINIGLAIDEYIANPSNIPHNVVVRNCKVHKFSATGIAALTADEITIEDNEVYDNAVFSMYGASGISTKNLVDWNGAGNSTQYKTKILRNICHDNRSTIPYLADKVVKRLSDGNGIIIDTHTPETIKTITFPSYKGRTLVANNICYNNGGSGAHALSGDHTDIINNTLYKNGQTSGPNNNYANVYAKYSSDVKIYNNIAYAKHGGRCTSNDNNGTGVVFGYNYLYSDINTVIDGPPNSTVAGGTGTGDIIQIPGYVSGTPVEPGFYYAGTFNFNITTSSPAINKGTPTAPNPLGAYPFPTTDFEKRARIAANRVDMGAYESGN